MEDLTDQTYLQTEQYKDSSNLDARIQIHERFSTNPYGWHRWVFDGLDLPPRAHILELGCGPGDLWLKNACRIPRGWNITLSDFSPGMVSEAQQRLCATAHRFTYGLLDAQSIPFADESFDGVLANHMLYHVPEVTKAISETHRVLRPGGRFYAATNGRRHLQELEQLSSRFDAHAYGNAHNQLAGLLTVHSFSLENGQGLLSSWFSQVSMARYEDALVITEVEPLLAWAMSWAKTIFPGDRVNGFLRFLEQQMTEQGAIHVTKDPGMFVAFREEHPAQ